METVERERALDVIKGVGILLVVVGHTSCPDVLKTWIYSFHMPLFFMVAGYLFNERKWKS